MSQTQFVYPQDDTVTKSDGPTPWQTVGPFFHYALPYDAGPTLVPEDHPGVIRLSGRVLDGEGRPVPDALVEIWQAGPDGKFPERTGIFEQPTTFRGFGRSSTDGDGTYAFVTLKPAAVPTIDGDAQAPHIAMSVFARGMLRRVATRVYFDDEGEANRTDPLLTEVGPDRATTLVARGVDGGYVFDVHFQGEQETVFLDIFDEGPRT
jgi:protocatechuate 3,4-dioxygenase, alpha subunit